jgi:hypothetical protein
MRTPPLQVSVNEDAEAEAELLTAMDQVGLEVSLDVIRGPIAEFALALRQKGLPPEQMIVRLKGCIQSYDSAHEARLRSRGDIVRRLVELAIEDYFSLPES